MTVKDLLNILDAHNARTISIIWNDKIMWEGEDITDIPQTLLGLSFLLTNIFCMCYSIIIKLR